MKASEMVVGEDYVVQFFGNHTVTLVETQAERRPGDYITANKGGVRVRFKGRVEAMGRTFEAGDEVGINSQNVMRPAGES